MKIFDCFPYFNEVELLELRIRMLQDHVSGFIITEGDLTHSGQPKPYTCWHTLQKMNVCLDKIRVVHANLPSLAQNSNHWSRERAQRDCAAQFFEPHAVYIVSDCDEIIDPQFVKIFAQAAVDDPHHIYRLSLAWLNARADLRVCDPHGNHAQFLNPFVCMQSHVTHVTLSDIREDQACQLHRLPWPSLFMLDAAGRPVDTGWHFSWMGGNERMKQKMRSYAHCDDPQQGIFQTAIAPINSDAMRQYLNNYKPAPGSHDPYGRSDYFLKQYPRHHLPACLQELTHLHKYFFGDQ